MMHEKINQYQTLQPSVVYSSAPVLASALFRMTSLQDEFRTFLVDETTGFIHYNAQLPDQFIRSGGYIRTKAEAENASRKLMSSMDSAIEANITLRNNKFPPLFKFMTIDDCLAVNKTDSLGIDYWESRLILRLRTASTAKGDVAVASSYALLRLDPSGYIREMHYCSPVIYQYRMTGLSSLLEPIS